MDALRVQKYFVLVGCILVSLTIGSVYSFGNLLPYLASYLAFENQSDFQQHQTVGVYCLCVIFQSLSMAIGTRMYLIFDFRRCALLGCFIMSFGVGITYFSCSNLFLCSLTLGIMVGIGSGIVLSASSLDKDTYTLHCVTDIPQLSCAA